MYSSSLSTWRRQREALELAALAPQKRGPKVDPSRAEALHIAKLTAHNERLQSRLDKAMLVIEAKKKLLRCWATRWTTTARGFDGGRASTRPNAWCRCGLPRPGVVARRAQTPPGANAPRGVCRAAGKARRAARPRPPLALAPCEQKVLLDTLNSEQFADTAPAAVYATLLDEDRYLGSVRTMYRLLAANAGGGERRRQLSHPAYAKPELLATAPNQVWSWDITKLKGPAKWTCFHLYVILDIFSRHVVGWLIAPRECSELARQLIAQTVARHDVQPGMLTLHADRGASMRFPSRWPRCWPI